MQPGKLSVHFLYYEAPFSDLRPIRFQGTYLAGAASSREKNLNFAFS
jgi:hypothetical protein